jgi:hypothetical protein
MQANRRKQQGGSALTQRLKVAVGVLQEGLPPGRYLEKMIRDSSLKMKPKLTTFPRFSEKL